MRALTMTDGSGNNSVSDTIYFSVEVLFPTITLAAIASILVAAVGLGMFIFMRKRKSSLISMIFRKLYNQLCFRLILEAGERK
jgi:hypothetical protein